MYSIEYRRSVEKDLRRLGSSVRARIVSCIQTLANEPRPNGYKVLRAQDNLCRVRVGDYRIIYSVHDDRLVVLVIAAKHRSDIYKDL